MGVNLILKRGNEAIADLGRSYHYKTDSNELLFEYNELEKVCKELKIDILSTLTTQASYTPNSYKELTEMLAENDSLVEYWVEELINLGKKMLIAELIDQEHYYSDEERLSVVEE